MTTAQDVLNVALQLPSEQRVEIAQQLLASVDRTWADDETAQEWTEEIQRRRDQIRRGEVQLHSWDKVRPDIERALADTDTHPIDHVEQVWAEEIRFRLERIRTGQVKLRPWEDVRRDIDRVLAERRGDGCAGGAVRS